MPTDDKITSTKNINTMSTADIVLKSNSWNFTLCWHCVDVVLTLCWCMFEMSQKYDMVVADTTIWAPRASYVDFTLPYSESGLVLVVKNNKPLNMWIFIKPLRWDLWLAILLASLLMGSFIWKLEAAVARPNDDRRGIAFFVPFTGMAFQDRKLFSPSTIKSHIHIFFFLS